MYLPKNNHGDFTPPPSGTHPAICYRVIDLGTQKVEWKGQIKFQRKVLLSWELPTERMDDDRPFTISQRYTFSTHEKARLRQDLESWRGKRFTEADFGEGGFDIKNILSKPCLLSIVHNEKEGGGVYANIHSVGAFPKGMEVSPQTNPSLYLALMPDRFDNSVFGELSDGLKETIRNSPEYQQLLEGNPPPPEYETRGEFEDDIPF